MNILIADSGSSKTDWCFLRENSPLVEIQTPGLNPYFLDRDGIESILLKELAPYIYFEKVDELYFYGAGLGSEVNRNRLDDVISDQFSNADIHLETDMLGAARGLFGKDEGIACIAGTGSNGCLYKNGTIVQQLPSLGYILGDEGSGTYLGKQLIKLWLTNELPLELKVKFEEKYRYSRSQLLEIIYRQPNPNIFLAGFAGFFAANISHPEINSIVMEGFSRLIQQMVMKVDNFATFPIGFCGSIAWHFQDQLREAASLQGIVIHTVVKNPMSGLQKYHSTEI